MLFRSGYTMGLGAAGALAANVSLYPKLPYAPLKDFAPISNVAFVPFFIIAHPSLPANNLEELIGLARAKPGELLLGYGGNGTAMHLSGELFKLMAKVQMVNVPYKGSGPATTDTVGGQLPLAVVDVASALAQVKAGRLKALAVTSARRVSAAPQVPTVAEAGLPGYDATGWFGDGKYVAFPVDVPVTGEYVLTFTYAALADAWRSVEVEGSTVADGLLFAGMEGWGRPSTVSIWATLRAGDRTVTVLYNTDRGSRTPLNLASLTLTPSR